MNTICGVSCRECNMKDYCKGCTETNGHPFGGECVIAECYKKGGETYFITYKEQLLKEFNHLGISGMRTVTDLCPLSGAYVNLEYTLPNGSKIKLLEDKNIYLGYQIEKENSDRCYGLVADHEYLLVCEYGCNGCDPEIIVYKKRNEEDTIIGA